MHVSDNIAKCIFAIPKRVLSLTTATNSLYFHISLIPVNTKQLNSTILILTDTLACFVETKLFLLNAVEMASAARRMASVGELRFSFVCF